jgi:penicillin-insensitive murein endopeptidase
MVNNLIIMLIWLFIIGCTHALPDFTSRLSTRLPHETNSEAIGEYALGCLRGAQTFSGKEKGLVFSQMKRGRYWGHPDLIKLLTDAGEEFSKMNKTLIIGDLSQSRGGPTLTGHNSHQTGLDVDIWFKMPSSDEHLSLKMLETEEMNSFSELGVDQIKLIKYFAKDPAVERIFINSGFKKKLCMDNSLSKLTAQEHHKLRAWWGHDDHIHVRLACPKDSPLCVSQKPIPEGDGCGEELNWWFTDEAKAGAAEISWHELKSIFIKKIKKLPEQCSFYEETF